VRQANAFNLETMEFELKESHGDIGGRDVGQGRKGEKSVPVLGRRGLTKVVWGRKVKEGRSGRCLLTNIGLDDPLLKKKGKRGGFFVSIEAIASSI